MMGRIAWRNLWRNWTRTAIVISAIAFSYGLMLILFGISDHSYQEMGDAAVEAVGGHVLVHGEGYWDLPTGGQVVPEAAELREEIETLDQVDVVAERVLVFGLLSTADSNESAQVLGVRPEDERTFYEVEDRLIEGEFFSDDREKPLVLGAEHADRLAVGLGDRVVVMASDLDGEVTRGLFFVDGITERTPGQEGGGQAYVRLEDLQELLGYGAAVTQIGIRLHDDEARHSVAAILGEQLDMEELEVLTWDQAVPELVALIEFDEVFGFIYVFIIMVIVALGITNTFLMAVMERVREIGLYSALGLTPRRIGMMIIIETALVTAVAMAIGFGIGLAGHFWMVEYGIDLGSVMDMDMEMAGISLDMMVIHSHIDPEKWIVGTLIIFGFICASALYPAWRATRLAPAEAMRFYE